MNFECPSCRKTGQVDDSRVPEDGVYATCPQCNNKFLIKREAPKDFEFEQVSVVSPVNQPPKNSPIIPTNKVPLEKNKAKSLRDKPAKKINPHAYCASLWGGILGLILCFVFIASEQNAPMIAFCIVGVVGVSSAWIYGLIILSRCWGIIQGTTARTTPGKAVGFLFIPIFNIYWTFIAHVGLATDANRFAESQNLKNRINYGLSVAACILLFIPYLNFVALIFFTVIIYQMAAFHNEIIDNWDKLSDHPDINKSDSTLIIVLAASLFVIAVLGILAAIAIPQFSAYRNKSPKSSVASNSNTETSIPQSTKKTYPSEWTEMFSDAVIGCKVYIDYSTINKSSPNTIIFKTRMFYFDKTMGETISTIEADCKKVQARTIDALSISSDGSQSKLNAYEEKSSGPLPLNSDMGKLIIKACAIAND